MDYKLLFREQCGCVCVCVCVLAVSSGNAAMRAMRRPPDRNMCVCVLGECVLVDSV